MESRRKLLPYRCSVGWLEYLSVFFICPHKEGQRAQLWELDDISTVKSIAVCDSLSRKEKHPLRSTYTWCVSMADPRKHIQTIAARGMGFRLSSPSPSLLFLPILFLRKDLIHLRLVSNCWSHCLHFQNSVITGLCHDVSFIWYWGVSLRSMWIIKRKWSPKGVALLGV